MAAAMMAAVLGASAGCSRSTTPTILVTVTIETGPGLKIPDNIDHLRVRLSTPGTASNAPGNERTLTYQLLGVGAVGQPGVSIVPGGGDGARIVQLEVEIGDRTPGPMTVEAVALYGQIPLVSRTRRVNLGALADGTREEVRLELARSCVLIECGVGQTCEPNLGCKLLEPSTDGGVPVDAGDAGEPNGPPCDCDGFFPFCVGASWKYAVCGGTSRTGCDSDPKTWVIGDASSIVHQGQPAPKFVLTRFAPDGRTRKFLTVVGARLLWLKDETFDRATWIPLQTRFFLPEKVRLDQGLIGQAPPLTYDEVVITPGEVSSETRSHSDTWSVVPVDESLREVMLKHGFPRETGLAGLDVICHRRVDEVPGDPNNSRNALYCFARHIGKIFETTIGGVAEQEWLVGSDLPKAGTCISVPDTPL